MKIRNKRYSYDPDAVVIHNQGLGKAITVLAMRLFVVVNIVFAWNRWVDGGVWLVPAAWAGLVLAISIAWYRS